MPRLAVSAWNSAGGDAAVVIVGDQRRRRLLAAGGGIVDNAVDVALDQERQQVRAVRGRRRVGGEGDHRLAGTVHHLRDLAHVGGEQRADDDLGAIGQRLRGGVAGTVGAGMVVAHQQGDVVGSGIGIGEIGGVAQRLGRRGWAGRWGTSAAGSARP